MGTVCWPYREPGLAGGQKAGAAAGTLECRPRIVPAWGQQEPSPQGH